MITRIIFTIFMAGVLSPGSHAQAKEWTLQECIDYAMKNNIRVQQGVVTRELASANYTRSRAAILPTLNGQVSNNYNLGRSIDPLTNQYINSNIRSNSASLSTNVILFSGLQQYNNIRQQKYEFLATQKDLETVQNDIALSVANFYLQILQNSELVTINSLQVESSRSQLERTRKLVEAGRLPLNNQLDLEAQLANDELNLVNAQNLEKIAYLNLTSLLQLPDDGTFKVSKPVITTLPVLPAVTATELFNQASTTRPELQSAIYRLQSSEFALKAAQGGRSPRLSAFGSLNTLFTQTRKDITGTSLAGVREIGYVDGTSQIVYTPVFAYQTRTTPFNTQLRDNFGQSFGVVLNVPIFNGWQVHTNVKRAALTVKQNELNLGQARITLYNTLAQALADAGASKARYDAAQKSFDAQDKSYQFNEKRFNAGSLNSFEFNVSKNNRLRAESTMINAKYEYIFRSKIIDFYLGKPITL